MELRPDTQGKVRDIYTIDNDKLLLVATDRISAFDYILPDEIPYKGEVLTRISQFWFEKFSNLVQNHLISTKVEAFPEQYQQYTDYLKGRSMLVKRAEALPVECIVRGYLTGSGLKEYRKSGTVCGIKLPEGLDEAHKLPEPIFTPSTKADVGDHDENISFDQMVEIIGEDLALKLKSLSLEIYTKAAEYAAERGIIIADTKFEFGVLDGEVIWIDEALTPDSSRFWPADKWQEGVAQPSFDKQYVRDWLKANWDMQGEPPAQPEEVIAETSKKYQAAYEIITGQAFFPEEK